MKENVCLCVWDCVGVRGVAAVENLIFPICVSRSFLEFQVLGEAVFLPLFLPPSIVSVSLLHDTGNERNAVESL